MHDSRWNNIEHPTTHRDGREMAAPIGGTLGNPVSQRFGGFLGNGIHRSQHFSCTVLLMSGKVHGNNGGHFEKVEVFAMSGMVANCELRTIAVVESSVRKMARGIWDLEVGCKVSSYPGTGSGLSGMLASAPCIVFHIF